MLADIEKDTQRRNENAHYLTSRIKDIPGIRQLCKKVYPDEPPYTTAQLRGQNVQVEDRVLEWERGKHGWIWDLDGNKIELYEEIMPDETR